MKNIIIFIFPLLPANCVHPKLNENVPIEKRITAIDFHAVLTFYDTSGTSYDILDEQETIYKYDDLLMYRLPVKTYIFQEHKKQPDSILPVSYTYWVFEEKGDSIAFSYSSPTDPARDTISVDTFLSNGFRNLEEVYKKSIGLNMLISRQKTSNEIVETYIYKTKPGPSFSDTTLFFYRKDYNDVKFSLIPAPGNQAKMKLYKLVEIFNGNPQAMDPFYKQPRQLSIEIRKEKIDDPARILSFFERFRKDLMAYRKRASR